MRAAIYRRVSSKSQEKYGGSLDGYQLDDCQELARKLDCTVVADYRDVGSGAEWQPGHLAMLEAAERGEFDVVLCWSSDRLCRNTAISKAIRRRLNDAQVSLLFVKEPDRDMYEELFSEFRRAIHDAVASGKPACTPFGCQKHAARLDRLDAGQVA